MVRKNRFTKALNHLKSTELDEKIQSLKEGPTNKTTGVYSLGKKNVSLDKYQQAKRFYPDTEGNWPANVPGVPGETNYLRPAGYWDGGRDWDTVQSSDFSYNNMVDENSNTSTAGLISEGGFVQTQLPPGSRGFILGPLVDSYTYNHGYDNYTTIGYLQKDTRQFVALGRISGQWKAGIHGSLDRPDRIWDTTNPYAFTAYNPSFTQEMAEWVLNEVNQNNYYTDIPYHYSGGVMQSQPGWQSMFGGLFPGIGALFGNMFGGFGFGGGGQGGSASTATPGGGGFGIGDPSAVTTGTSRDGDDPSNHGNSGDNNLWGNIWNNIKDNLPKPMSPEEALQDAKDRFNGAWEGLKDFAGQLPPPAYEVSFNIASSILQNKPIQQDNSNYPPSDINNLLDNLDPTSVPTSNQQVNYSDDNFYVDDSGQVHAHTPETYAEYGNQTGPVSSNFPTNVWSAIAQGVGYDNPIASAGEAQTQFVVPDDGSEPYFLYTDHAYHNTQSANPAEISNPITNFLSNVVHTAADLIYNTTPDSPNTGAMSGYPPNIAGDIVTNIKIPYSQLPPNYQAQIQSQGYNPGTKTESYKRKIQLLKEIKKPVVLAESSTKLPKLKKYRPNFKGKFTPQNTPDVTASPKSDQLVASGNAKGQAWREQDKHWQGYETTERMNIIHDQVGHGSLAWDAIIEDSRRKNGWKNREIQEQLNQYYAVRAEKQLDDIQEEEDPNSDEIDKYMKDPLVKQVRQRLLTQIDYPDKPSRKGYPDQPPEQLAPNGFHAKYGKKSGYYKKLDPVSAIAMKNAPTEDPEIDDNVKKASVKPKVSEGKKSDWKGDLIYYSRADQKVISEVMNTSSIFDMRLEPEKDQPVVKVDITAGPANFFNDVHWETYEESENYAPEDYRGDVEYTSGGTGSDLGGFSDDMITMAGSTVNYGTSSTPGSYKMWSSPMDMSKSDTISITVRAGNNSNGGMKPFMPMYAYLWSPELAKTGHETFGYHYLEGEGTHDYNGYQRPLFDPTDQSGSNTGNGISEHQTGNDVTLKINIPPEFRNKNNQIYFHASHTDWVADSDNARYGKHLGSHRLPVAGIDHFDLNDWPATGGGHWMHSLYSYISRSEDQMDETPSGNLGFENNYQSMGWTFWHNIQSNKHANWPMGQDANGGGIPIQIYDYANEQWEDWWINGGDPAPITGSVWGTNSSHHGGGDKATNADYEHIGRAIYNKFKYAPLYGIKDISTNRTNPMSVLVGLDDPAASAFVRMGQELIALSPEQRRKKFQEMMDAAKAYQDKFLGKDFPGSNTTFGEVPSAPINWEEVQALYDKENYGYQNWGGNEVAQIAAVDPVSAAGLIMASGLTWGQVSAFIAATLAVVGGKELLGLVNDGIFEMDDVISFMSSTADSDILWKDGTYSSANDPYGIDQAHAGNTGNIDLDQWDAENAQDKEFLDNYDEKLQELKDKVKEAGQGLDGWQRVDDPGYQKALEELGNLKKERTRIRKAREKAEREAGQQYKDDKQQARDERAQQELDRASDRITAQRQREIAYQKAKELWNLRNPGKEFPVKPGDKIWQEMGASLDMDYRPGGKTLSEEQGIEKIVKYAERKDKNTMSQLHKDIARVRDISVKLSNANKEGDPEKIAILKIEQNEAIRIYQTNKGLAKLKDKEDWKKQDAIKNSTFGRINAIRQRFAYKGQPTPSPDGFPTDPVQPPGPDGFSPKYAQGHENRYKRLDPQSAETMSRAPTGDPKIDNLVKKQARKKK